MSNSFDAALSKLGECVELVGKGLEGVVDNLYKTLGATDTKGTRIRIKVGSKICVGKGVYAILQSDVEAILVDNTEAEATNKEST